MSYFLKSASVASLSKKILRTDSSIFAAVPDSSGGVYLGGQFIGFAENNHQHGSVISTNSDTLFPYNYAFNSSVFAIAPDDSGGAYFGGNFTFVNGVARTRLAYINSSGQLTDWNPSANSTVFALATLGDNVYIGGNFTGVAGTTRNYLAAVNTAGSLLTWNPSASSTVFTFSKTTDTLTAYAEGNNFSPFIVTSTATGNIINYKDI